MKLSDLVKTPQVPNFLVLNESDANTGHTVSVGIGVLTDSDLRRIGKRWTEKLIENAKAKRKLQNVTIK